MNPLNSKYYPKLMFLAIIVVSLLLLFNIVNIMDKVKINLEKKSTTGNAGITGFVSEIDRTNNPINSLQNKTNFSEQPKQEVYTAKSFAIYYSLIIGIIAAIFITFSVLKSTVMRNIEIEEEARRL